MPNVDIETLLIEHRKPICLRECVRMVKRILGIAPFKSPVGSLLKAVRVNQIPPGAAFANLGYAEFRHSTGEFGHRHHFPNTRVLKSKMDL